MTWFSDWFGKEYLEVYSHRSDEQAEREIEFISKILCLNSKSKVLDIACGAGRHVAVLAKKNINAFAGDLSAVLLRETKKRDKNILITQYDMRHLPFRAHSFSCVISLFTSFGYFESDEEHLNVLVQIKNVLENEGLFFLDYLNKDSLLLNIVPESTREISTGIVKEKRWYNSELNRIEKKITLIRESGQKVFNESVRVYSLDELQQLFVDAELEIKEVYGDFDGSKHSAESPRTLIVSRRTK